MLYHNDRVANFNQFFDVRNQHIIISWVESYGWLIKYIDNAFEPCAYLGSKTNALGLASRESLRLSRKRHILQAYTLQELQTLSHIFENRLYDFFLHLTGTKFLEKIDCLTYREFAQLPDMLTAHKNREKLLLESISMTNWTANFSDKL